jgi:plastocyanin
MTTNKHQITNHKKSSRLSSLKITAVFASVCFNQLVQASPIVIHVNDMNGQPLSEAVVEVIRQNNKLTPLPISSEPVVMDQVNKRFLPDLILIHQGQSVVFPNSDNIRHHVYSFSQAKTFEIKLYAGKPEKAIEFDKNGVVIVGCNIHDSMVGSIYVAKDSAMISDDKGKVTLYFDPNVDKISVWHPLQESNPEERKIIDLKDYPSEDKPDYNITINVGEAAPRDTFGDSF